MLYRPELTAHRGGCSNAQLLQARVPLGSPSPAKVRFVNSDTEAGMSTMAEDLPNLRNGITHQQKRTYPLTLCEEIPPNRSTMRGKQPVAENHLFHRRSFKQSAFSLRSPKNSAVRWRQKTGGPDCTFAQPGPSPPSLHPT